MLAAPLEKKPSLSIADFMASDIELIRPPVREIMQPEIGTWFQESVYGYEFEVIAFDDRSQSVSVQHLDGSLEEYDEDTWLSIEPHSIPRPQEWLNIIEALFEENETCLLSDELPPIEHEQDLSKVEGLDHIIDDLEHGWTDQTEY